jgi:hypothetical protein
MTGGLPEGLELRLAATQGLQGHRSQRTITCLDQGPDLQKIRAWIKKLW